MKFRLLLLPLLLLPFLMPRLAGAITPTEHQQVRWYLASQHTLNLKWFGSIAANHPHQKCVKHHESDRAGGYAATDHGDGDEENSGAYQDDQSTWDSSASGVGRYDLVGVKPMYAAWWDQEQVNWFLYMTRGDQPWGGRC